MTKEEQFAYCAGLLDGEGCFHASRNEHCNTFRYGITVNLDYNKPLLRLVGLFGGEVKPRPDGGYTWIIPRETLTRCLDLVIPYLIVKREQAVLLREMRATFVETGRPRGQAPPDGVVYWRQVLTDKITSLKYDFSFKPIPVIPKKCLYAYTAGLLDAEGSFGVYHGKGNRYLAKVQVGMVDPTALNRVHAAFGGCLMQSSTGHVNTVWYLALERSAAAEICRKTAAYRLLKREQADIVVRIHNHIQLWQSRRRGNTPLPSKVIAQRERWYQRCRFLNSLSARAETNSSRPTVASDSPNLTEPQGKELAETANR